MGESYYLKYLFFLVIPFLFSCDDYDRLQVVDCPNDFKQVFELFWHKMNSNYVFWDIDSTNWDNVYFEYKDKFLELDINNEEDKIKSIQYFNNITRNLIDGHFYIEFSDAELQHYSEIPSLMSKKKLLNFHDPFSYQYVDTNYLDSDYIFGVNINISSHGTPQKVLCGSIQKTILFISINKFSLLESYNLDNGNEVQLALDFFFEKITKTSDYEGVIIDVRANLGGDLGDLNFLLGKFIKEPLHFGYTQTKLGLNRLDLSPWIKSYINPEPQGFQFDKPIIVLADMYSASLSEALVLAVQALPNGCFVGESTWGAIGPLTTTALYNAGSFEVGEYMKVQTSSCKLKSVNDRIFEGVGCMPDVLVPFSEEAILLGNDLQLEKAINTIKTWIEK